MDLEEISGLEAEITYNGLKLNERLATSGTGPRYKVNEIGGLDDADVRDAREVNPARDGELALPAYYGGRTITITGRILARNVAELRQMQRDLRTAFGSLSEKSLTWSIDPSPSVADIYIDARKSAPLQMREAQVDNRPYRDFLVTLRASDPRFYSHVTQSVTVNNLYANTAFYAYNKGNATSDPVIRLNGPLYPLTPSQSQFSIKNNATGQEIFLTMYSAVTGATDFSMNINSASRSISGDYNYTAFLSGSQFPSVAAATNYFTVSGLTGTGSVSLYFKDSWI